MSDIKKRCSQPVGGSKFEPTGIFPDRCSKKPTVFADGVWWCTFHDPKKADERDARKTAKINAKFAPRPDETKPLRLEIKRLTKQLAEVEEIFILVRYLLTDGLTGPEGDARDQIDAYRNKYPVKKETSG